VTPYRPLERDRPGAFHVGDDDAGRAHPSGSAKRVAILQSAYIPWKGYFDIIGSVDEFILFDDAQYTKRDWRNRNRLRTPAGTAWLTIPVMTKGRFGQPIRDATVSDASWAERHWKTIVQNYARARCFEETAPTLRELYQQAADEPSLSRINELFIRAISGWLGLSARITSSSDYDLAGDRVERLVHVCEQAGAGEYLSGPAARGYLEADRFAARGITVRWMDYSGYLAYRQLYSPPFIHEVTIIDLLVNEGLAGARQHMLSTRPDASG
jgi:hypothetical protein